MSATGLSRYILGRLLLAVPLVLAVVVVNFVIIQITPGDPVTALIGDYPAPPDYVAQVRHAYGLDQPIPVRLVRYLAELAHGNLGYSFANQQPVLALIGQRVPATLELTVTALLAATLLGVLLGLLAARGRGSIADAASQLISLVGFSIPEFWLGQVLIVVFAVSLGWLPSQGNMSVRSNAQGFAAFQESLKYLILPATALAFRYLALIARITRASLLEVLSADFILAARARGASERTVLLAHALRNAAAPVITVVGYNVGFIFAGSALIETVFGWPGIGRLLFDSITNRDYPVLMGILLLISITVVVANLLTDVVHALLDPRVRQA